LYGQIHDSQVIITKVPLDPGRFDKRRDRDRGNLAARGGPVARRSRPPLACWLWSPPRTLSAQTYSGSTRRASVLNPDHRKGELRTPLRGEATGL